MLIGIHDANLARSISRLAEARHYESVVAPDLDELAAEARTFGYSRIIMDANFGFPGSPDILPAVQIYEIVKPEMDKGLMKLLAISGSETVVKLAQARGVPAEIKGEVNMLAFLKESTC